VAPAQKQSFDAHQALEVPGVVKSSPTEMWLFPAGGVKPLVNVTTQALAPDLQTAVGGVITLQARPKDAGVAMLSVLRQFATSRTQSSPSQTIQPVTIDWTDPTYNVHWTGSITQNLTQLSMSVHGVGPNTDVTIALTLTPTLNGAAISGANASCTIKGTVIADVDTVDWSTGVHTTVSGRATIDSTISGALSIPTSGPDTFSAKLSMNADFQVQDGGTWTSADVQQVTDQVSGSWSGSSVTLDFSGVHYDGVSVGANLYWGKHTLSAQQVTIDTSSGDATGTLTDNVLLSDGTTGQLTLDFTSGLASATVSGWIKDSTGATIATITGSLSSSNKITINWTGGSAQVADWLYV
jgi:hypothetical protein